MKGNDPHHFTVPISLFRRTEVVLVKRAWPGLFNKLRESICCKYLQLEVDTVHGSPSLLKHSKTSKSFRVTHSWWFHMTTKSIRSVCALNVRGSVWWKELSFHRNSSCVCFRCVGSVIILFAETGSVNSLKGNILTHVKSTTSFLNYSSFLHTHTDLIHTQKTKTLLQPRKASYSKPPTSDAL